MKLFITTLYAALALSSVASPEYESNLNHINIAENSGARWELNANKFVQIPHLHFSRVFKGYKMTYNPERTAFATDTGVPDSWDWRDHGIVGKVKNQEQCGSCWAFSAVGSLESQIAKVTGTSVVLSEQEMVDCVKNVPSPDNSSTCCDGCQGGEMYFVYRYLIANKSEDDTSTQYPYVGSDQDCQVVPSTVKIKLKSFVALPIGDEESVKSALYAHGPISVGVNANLDWQLYKKGIYNPSEKACDPSISAMDHGVILVGYGAEDGLDYWIIRNSWGENWGEQGYIRLARGHNSCGVANAAIYPVIDNSVQVNIDSCHDNCGNSCSPGPCGSCSNLCCDCGCSTCKCCHQLAFLDEHIRT